MQTEEKVKRMPAKAVTITSHKKVPGTHANSAVARLGAYLDLIYVGTIPGKPGVALGGHPKRTLG